ncbi:MAG: glucosamine inositolphosphorylceramide transferase family protein [Bacteroidota bacterium]
MEAPRTLSFGILCNSTTLPQWQANALQLLINNPACNLKLVVVNATPSPKKSIIKKLFSRTLLFTQYENRFLKIPALQKIDLQATFSKCTIIQAIALKKGKFSHYFSADDIETIKSHELDFIVRFGFGIIKGDILTAAKYGVWSYHHGDEIKFRGGPAGLWEIFNRSAVTAAILQQLTPTLDGGKVLKKGYFKTIHHSYPEQLDTLLSQTSSWLLQVALQVAHSNKLPEIPSETKAEKLHKAPGNLAFSWFWVLILVNKIRFKLNNLFKVEIWNIGTLTNTIEEVVEGKKLSIKWLPGHKPQSLTYRADPFVLTEPGREVFLYEKFDYHTHKGHIEAIEHYPLTNTYTQEKIIIQPGIHHSYPFAFEYNETRYCLPENFEANNAVLYFMNNNNDLKKVSVVLDGIPAVDPTLVYHDDTFWLFFTLKNALPNAQLFIYHSATIDGPYEPHILNPVKTDISSARPAGNFFRYKGDLIRPSQNCTHTYGGSLVLNRVIKLSKTDYVEEKLTEVMPFDEEYNKGLHHLSVAGNVLAVDGKKYIFSLSLLLKRLQGK